MSTPPDAQGIGRIPLARHSDELLLAASSNGDRDSFGELHRRYGRSVYTYCLMRLRDPHAAEDAAQEVFLRAVASKHAAVRQARAWLFTLARNVVIDMARKKKSAGVTVDVEAVGPEELSAPSDEHLVGDATGSIFLALRRIPVRQRRSLVLREFHDMSSAEIASELDTTPANADVLVARGRKAFSQAYASLVTLPPACRSATEIMYRDLGSGVSDTRLAAMQAHLTDCERCSAEYHRAHSPRYLRGIVFGLQSGGLAVERVIQGVREAVSATGAAVQPHLGTAAAAKAGATLALAAVVLTPAAVDRIPLSRVTYESQLRPVASLAVAAPKAVTSQVDGPRSQWQPTGSDESQPLATLTVRNPLKQCEPLPEAPTTEHAAAGHGHATANSRADHVAAAATGVEDHAAVTGPTAEASGEPHTDEPAHP